MKTATTQYLNEIVSLTILALMAIALIAAQAGAVLPTGTGRSEPGDRSGYMANTDNGSGDQGLHAGVRAELDFATLAKLFDLGAAANLFRGEAGVGGQGPR